MGGKKGTRKDRNNTVLAGTAKTITTAQEIAGNL
jgi:hypothetical protein